MQRSRSQVGLELSEAEDHTGETGEQADEQTEEQAEKAIHRSCCTVGRVFKWTLLLTVVAVVILASDELTSHLTELRQNLSEFPLGSVLVVTIVLNGCRMLMPPIYYLFPFNLIVVMYLADTQGVPMGALYYQLLKLPNIFYFVVIRKFYTNKLSTLLDNPRTCQCFSEFRGAIQIFDKNWGQRFEEPSKCFALWLQQLLMICAFCLTLYFDDLLSLFWTATRTSTRWSVFSSAVVVAGAAEYVKTSFKMRAYAVILDTVTGTSDDIGDSGNITASSPSGAGSESGESFLSQVLGLFSRPWFEILVIAIGVLGSTVFVHGSNVLFCARSARKALCPETSAGSHAQV